MKDKTFYANQNLKFTDFPRTQFEGAFIGNGSFGASIYHDEENALLIKTGHNEVFDVRALPAGCDENGYTAASHCSYCGMPMTIRDITPPLGHSVVYSEAVEPTCTTDGRTESCYCNRCHWVLQGGVTRPAFGHTEVLDGNAVAPDCVNTGLSESSHCTVCGEIADTDTLVKKILRFRTYFGEKGGVTVSGGEPLMQPHFVSELFEKLHSHGINTALDTSGCVFNENVEKLLENTDTVLLDHKYADEDSYYLNTGCHLADAERFLDELEKSRASEMKLRRENNAMKVELKKNIEAMEKYKSLRK